MQITLENITKVDISTYIGMISNYLVKDGKYFIVLKNIEVLLSINEVIRIPIGYRFDGSSVPNFLRSLLPRYGAFLFASLLHDYMYYSDYKRKETGLRSARMLADKEMLIWSDKTNTKGLFRKLDNRIRFYAVRLFGKRVYLR